MTYQLLEKYNSRRAQQRRAQQRRAQQRRAQQRRARIMTQLREERLFIARPAPGHNANNVDIVREEDNAPEINAPEIEEEKQVSEEPEQTPLLKQAIEQLVHPSQKEKWINVFGNMVAVLSNDKENVKKYISEHEAKMKDASADEAKSICDLTAHLVMVGAVGVEAYEKLKAAYEKEVYPKQQGHVSAGGGDASLFKVEQGNGLKNEFEKWANNNQPGVVQVKFDATNGPHTFVIEKTANRKFIVYQSYQAHYGLGQSLGIDPQSYTKKTEKQPKTNKTSKTYEVSKDLKVGGGQQLEKSKIMEVIIEPLSHSLDHQNEEMPKAKYEQAFGMPTEHYNKTIKILRVALFSFNYQQSPEEKEIAENMQNLLEPEQLENLIKTNRFTEYPNIQAKEEKKQETEEERQSRLLKEKENREFQAKMAQQAKRPKITLPFGPKN